MTLHAGSAADSGILAAALEETDPVERLGALFHALEVAGETTPELIRCLNEELKKSGGDEKSKTRLLDICRKRQESPIETTFQLVDVIRSAMPGAALREKQHPAKRSFQAIRIAVNDELRAVERMLQSAVPRLNPGGRLAVISFHSLEDRIVKTALSDFAKGCTCPPSFPVCVCGKKPDIKLVNRKPIVSGDAELAENPRARSAKLRVAEKV